MVNPFYHHGCYDNYTNANTNASNASTEPIVIYVTSFGSSYYTHINNNGLEDSILEYTQNFTLIVYHEDSLPPIPGTCGIDMRARFPWLEWELHNEYSGLNQYFKLATYQEPHAITYPGALKTGHILMFKVLAIQDALASAPPGSLVVWMDTDTTIKKPLSGWSLRWLLQRDVTYIPFFLQAHRRYYFMENRNCTNATQENAMLYRKVWRVESGTMAFTVSNKTRALTAAALGMYRGDLFNLAKRCYQRDPLCSREEVGNNVYTNDIYIWALLLNADALKNEQIFSANLSHGWFAMAGYDFTKPGHKGPRYYVWGNFRHVVNFPPSPHNDTLVTPFHIGEYIFHHFGAHRKGALSAQFRNKSEISSHEAWRFVSNPGTRPESLFGFIGNLRRR